MVLNSLNTGKTQSKGQWFRKKTQRVCGIATSEPTKLYRHPVIVLNEKNNQEVFNIELNSPLDFCVRDMKAKDISKYQDLVLEISRMWNTKTRLIYIGNIIFRAQSLPALIRVMVM